MVMTMSPVGIILRPLAPVLGIGVWGLVKGLPSRAGTRHRDCVPKTYAVDASTIKGLGFRVYGCRVQG